MVEAEFRCGLAPIRKGRRGGRRRELRVERQTDDLVRSPLCHRTRRLLARRVPIAHRNKRAVVGAEQSIERLCLRRSVRKQRRGAAEPRIDLARSPHSPARDQSRQRHPQQPGQTEDRGVAEQVEEERLDSLEQVRPTQIHQNDGGARHQPETIGRVSARTSAATCSGGVSVSTPWPRLNIQRAPPSDCRSSLTAASSAAPPVNSSTGSRFP